MTLDPTCERGHKGRGVLWSHRRHTLPPFHPDYHHSQANDPYESSVALYP
jgi:hypothetical protein